MRKSNDLALLDDFFDRADSEKIEVEDVGGNLIQEILLREITRLKKSFKKKIDTVNRIIERIKNDVILIEVPKLKGIDDLKISAIDGSNGLKRLVGLDLTVLTAASITINHPKKGAVHVVPNAKIMDLTNPEVDTEVSFHRTSLEFETAVQTIDTIKPDALFIDGSLIPPSTLEPEMFQTEIYYRLVGNKERKQIGLLANLILSSKKNDVLLAGIVKRTRSTAYSEKFVDPLLLKRLRLHDGIILDKILLEKQMETGKAYMTELIQVPPKRFFDDSFGISRRDILMFYIKPTQAAPVIRVEIPTYVSQSKHMDTLLSILFKMASPEDGTPLPIALAHEYCTLTHESLSALTWELIFSAAEYGEVARIYVSKRRGGHD